MSVLDFLFQGSPPASVTTYGETTSNVPTWYSDYTQGLISRANAIAAEPYQPYSQARIAQFDPMQMKAFEQADQLSGQYQPLLDSSRSAISTAGSGSSVGAASPYIQQALQYNPSTAAAGALGQASQYVQQGSTGTAGLASPYMQQSSQLSNQAAQTGLGGIQDYMNPYQDQVVNRIGELGARNLRENLLPSIQDRAIQAGTFGGSRSGEAIGRALRDTQESTLAQQTAARQQGYGQAGQQLQADRARQLQVAQQQAAIGQSLAGLSSADQQRLLAAGSQMGALGQAQGNLAGAAGTQNLQAAQQMGALSNQDFTRMLQSGQAMGALGQQTQQMGLQNVAALEAAGASQQQQAQRSLDQAYQDFLNQREYDRGNIGFLNAAVRGLQVPTSTTTESTGPASVYQPSPLSQLGSALATGYGLKNLIK